MNLRKTIPSLSLYLLVTIVAFSSPASAIEPNLNGPKIFKGQVYLYWGYNRAWYTKSDIHFHGNDYDFTLSDVVAHDKQSAIAIDPYLIYNKLTIPQSNFRVGYFFTDHWSLSFGNDHMKYVMDQNQNVPIDGYISNSGTEYDNVYEGETIQLKDDFLKFEHTDGLNYINLELRRMDNLLRLNKYDIANIDVNILEGFGAGILFPRTNTTLIGKERHDDFHVSGYGLSAVAGLNITFWDLLFLQSEIKGGFINMPDIRTTDSKEDKAKQHFFYTQINFLIGLKFKLFKTTS